jgi:predicted CopG family antitoxin
VYTEGKKGDVQVIDAFRTLCANACAQMTKTISLSEDAYKVLKRQKLPGESFSDAVLRLCKTKAKLSDILPMYPELIGNEEYLNAVSETRESIDKRLS